ncbi:MAG: hypothetical protein JWN31_1445 [Frankiales bacterium]|nr:hypothetical protein [Frankiales bacterium]
MPTESGAARRTAVLLLALAALGAGVIHLVHAPPHVLQWLPLGLSFYASGVLQVAWAGAVVVSDSRKLLYVGAGFSAVFVGFYVLTRTLGMPLGPEAFQPESFGRADVLCTALELPVALGGLLLAQRRSGLRMTRRLAAVFTLSAVFVSSATGVALAAPLHHHRTCDVAPVLTGKLDARGVDTGVTAYFRCQLLHSHDHKH